MIRAPSGTVWDIVSNLDGETTYWKGTKSIRNISCDGNIVRRQITLAFRNKRCMQTVRLNPIHSIEFEFTEGIIKGSKTISLTPDGGNTILTASWDIRMSGLMEMFSGAIMGHIKKGTLQALNAIKIDAEGIQP